MERIREALNKAKASQPPAEDSEVVATPAVMQPQDQPCADQEPAPLDLPQVQLDPAHLERNRIVSFDMNDPSHMAFNILRTKIHQTMADNSWKSIAISSPNPGAGKTMVAINLAFSLARQKNCRVVLIDLDLRRPTIAKVLGIQVETSIGQYLTGRVDVRQCMLQIAENLVVLPNNQPVKISSELMSGQWSREIIQKITKILAPDIIIFDLPPMLSSDDTMGILPYVDCGLIIIDDGISSYKEVDQCDRQFSESTNLIGHVLNKSTDKTEAGYDYYGY